MVGGVPVLGQDDVIELLGDSANWFNDQISARNGKCPAGAEIVLHVDDEEDVLWGDLHSLTLFRTHGHCR